MPQVAGREGAVGWDTVKPDGMPRKLIDVSHLRGLGSVPTVELDDGRRRTHRCGTWNAARKRRGGSTTPCRHEPASPRTPTAIEGKIVPLRAECPAEVAHSRHSRPSRVRWVLCMPFI